MANNEDWSLPGRENRFGVGADECMLKRSFPANFDIPQPIPEWTEMLKIQRLKEVAFYLWSRSPRRNLQRFTSIGSREYVADPFQVWCLSTGRVGSKTLAELANLSGKVAAVHEPWPKTFGLSRLSYEYGKDSACQQVFVESVTAVREKIVSEVENLHFIETSPQCTFLAPALKEVFPASRFIHIVRHPGAVVRSGMRRGWYGGHVSDLFRLVPDSGDLQERWGDMNQFQKNVWLWCETNRWILDFLQRDMGKHLLIRAEDIFNGDEEVLAGFFEFIGAGSPRQAKVERILGLQLNSQAQGEFPEFEDWSREERNFLETLGGDLMGRLGYR